MNITVAITGASGTIYARRLIDFLSTCTEISVIYVVMTNYAQDVARHEIGDDWHPADINKVQLLDNTDLFTPIASGSAAADAMVIVPCSMGMVGRITGGISNDLVSRAADVMLKERLPLILVPRESPLSLIHLRNLTTLVETGAVVLPAAPSFYHNPTTVAAVADSIVERIIKQLKLTKEDSYKWKS